MANYDLPAGTKVVLRRRGATMSVPEETATIVRARAAWYVVRYEDGVEEDIFHGHVCFERAWRSSLYAGRR